MFSKIAKNIYLLLCSIVITFVFIEFVIMRGILGFHGGGRLDILEYDKSLGWKLKKNIEGRDKTFEWDVYYKTNAEGFRDTTHPLTKEGKRILILGDSITEGMGVDQNDNFTKIIEKKLGSQFEVFNFGVRGYDIIQEDKCLHEIGLKYNPDIVIQVLCENDFGPSGQPLLSIFGAYLNYRPRYKIENMKNIFYYNAKEPYVAKIIKYPTIARWFIKLLNNSATISYIRGTIFRKVAAHKKKRLIHKSDRRSSDKYDEQYKDAVRIIYSNISKLVRKNRLKFIVVTIDYNDTTSFAELQKIASNNNIPLLNISLTHRKCYKYDGHPNRLGHQKIASKIIKFMLKENLIK